VQDNVVVIIQIPLKKKKPATLGLNYGGGLFGGPAGGAYAMAYGSCCAAPACASASFGSSVAAMTKPAVDVEHAIVKLGEAAGPFPSLQGGWVWLFVLDLGFRVLVNAR
jgi:hypothetical protein